jgi:hypothetical protein
MNHAKTKPSRRDIQNTFNALNIMSGKNKTPDYIGYSMEKRAIENTPMSPQEYRAACNDLAERYGI